MWELELWELNGYMSGFELRRKKDAADCIMTGFYAAYYTNGGKKAKSPNDLVRQLFAEKQSVEEGLRQIERIKRLENGGKGNE